MLTRFLRKSGLYSHYSKGILKDVEFKIKIDIKQNHTDKLIKVFYNL